MQCIHSLKSDYHNCNIFVRDDLTMLVLPTFFSKAISRTGVVWNRIKEERHDGFVRTSYQEQEISKVSCTIIHNKLKQFFNWLGDYSQSSEYVSVDNHHNLPEELLNFYVNDVLIIKQRKGQHSIDQHLMALRYYYNYLAMTGFTNGKDIRVKPKFKSFARQNTLTRQSVKYLSPDLCRLLYQNCDSLRDELLLRTGGELGLRSKENLGLLLEDFNIGNKKHPGFKSLFTQLRTDPEKMEFQYHLQGKFTKGSRGAGGKPRVLFIHRTLLVKFKRYFDDECRV